MSPWTALLESLHSALIDELIERHPDPKATLGMPRRLAVLGSPSDEIEGFLLCPVSFDGAQAAEAGSSGVALLALCDGARKKLKTDLPQLWRALLKRAGSEFMRRGIQPRLAPPVEIDTRREWALPSGLQPPARVIWIPITIPAGPCFLGMAV